jgi:hypothetical protein
MLTEIAGYTVPDSLFISSARRVLKMIWICQSHSRAKDLLKEVSLAATSERCQRLLQTFRRGSGRRSQNTAKFVDPYYELHLYLPDNNAEPARLQGMQSNPAIDQSCPPLRRGPKHAK